MTAVLCSRNEGKLRELRAALPNWTIEPLDVDDYPPETGESYADNARIKARHGRALAPADAWVLGEDSGIEVAALDGAPGVRSARFGSDDPVGRVLEALGEAEDRRARYVSTLVCVFPDGRELEARGVLPGRISRQPRGSEGFGYDPVFVPEGEERTVAELGNAWKREHSHRARAARELLTRIPVPPHPRCGASQTTS